MRRMWSTHTENVKRKGGRVTMKGCILPAAAVLLGAAAVCSAQEELEPKEPWDVTGSLAHMTYSFAHDSLQQRADYEYDWSDDWRDGSVSGNGWGVRVAVTRGEGIGEIRFMRSNYDYDLTFHNGTHEIETQRRDVDLTWKQPAGTNQRGVWGWNLGIRYVGTEKKILLTEGDHVLRDADDINWYMIQTGYWGKLHPFGTDMFMLHGSANVLFGEASGLARESNDTAYDGVIEETYDQEYSVAYGFNGTVGVILKVMRDVRVVVDYHREWLYSFKATETGTVVFPDNSDALFTENHHGVYTYLDVTF